MRFLSIFLIFVTSLATPAVGAGPKRILILGDSITEGYGVAKSEAFPALLGRLLAPAEILNGGSSGATSASGPSRLKWYLKSKPDILVIELGANDALRGVNPAETKKNLRETIELAKKRGVAVVLAGMKAPPNYGNSYANAFARIYPELAESEKVVLIPFFLEGVAGDPKLNQPDGIHPNEKGHAIVARTVARYLKPLL